MRTRGKREGKTNEQGTLRRRAAWAQHGQVNEQLPQRAVLEALSYNVVQRISGKLEQKDLFPTIVTAIHDALSDCRVALFLIDEEAECLRLQAVAGHRADVCPADFSIALGEGMVGYAAASGTSQVSGDVRQAPHYVRKADDETKSELAVPIEKGGKVLGVLDLQSDTSAAFDEIEVRAMETLSAHIAIAIENARLFEETRCRAERLAVVNRIAKAVGASLQLNELMETIYQEIASVFEHNAFLIALYHGETNELSFLFGVEEGERVAPLRVPLGGLSSLVVAEKRPLHIRDYDKERDALPTPVMVGKKVKLYASWLGVPLQIGERVIGVISVMADRPNAYSEEQVALLLTIADQIAIAIENARLHEAVEQELDERKRGEKEIRRLSQYLESVIDNATVWLNVLDKDGCVVIWNKAAEKISGYSREELVRQGKEWDRLLYPDEAYRNEVLEKEAALRESGDVTKELEATIRCKDGRPKIISWTSRNLQDGSGNLIGSIAIVRDITLQKQAEEALRLSEERFALAVRGSDEGLWDWDIQNRTLYWSPRFKELLGYAPDEIDVDLDTFNLLLHPDDREPRKAAIEAHLKDRVPFDVEGRLRTKSGEYRWFRARGQALWDEAGNPVRMVGFTGDISEQKRAAAEIRKLNQYLESIIDNANVWLNVLDNETNVLTWNKAAEEISGYSRDEVLGHNKIWEWLYPDAEYRKEINEKAAAIRATGQLELETTIRCKNGRPKIISWTSRNLQDGSGNLIGSIAIVRDITVQKQAEEALRFSEERFALAVQGANDGLYDWDILNNTLYWSPRMKEMLGYADGELDVDFDTFETLLHPDDKEHTNAAIDAHLKDRVPFDIEQRLLAKSGEYVWVHARGQAVWDENGQPTRMVGSSTDITELKQAEEKLEKERNLLRTVIDNLPDNIFVKDAEGRYIISNSAFARFLVGSMSEEEVVGKTVFDFYPKELAEEYDADDQKVFQTGQPVGKPDQRTVTLMGDEVWQQVFKTPLRDSTGKIIGLVGIERDVTEKKRAEETLEEERNLLRTVIDNVPDTIYVKDANYCYTACNIAQVRSVGLETPDEVIGKTDFDIYPQDMAAEYRENDEGVIQTGQLLLNRPERAQGSAGDEVWYLSTKVPLKERSGKIVGLVGISRDITELKEAEAEIRKLNQYLESIIDNANVWLNMLDEEANIILWNKAAERISGYSRDEVLGHNKIWEWLYPNEAYRKQLTEKVAAILKGGNVGVDLETTIRL